MSRPIVYNNQQFTREGRSQMYDERNNAPAPETENAIDVAARILSRVETMIDQLVATQTRVHGTRVRDEAPRGLMDTKDTVAPQPALLPMLRLIDERLDRAMNALSVVRSGL